MKKAIIKKKKVSFDLSHTLVRRIDRLARLESRSRTAQVEVMLKAQLTQ